MNSGWFQRYVLPGFIFQSAVIGGAYGSGKELAEFFLGHGPIGGFARHVRHDVRIQHCVDGGV